MAVPVTYNGKTFRSLAWALRHVGLRRCEREVYVTSRGQRAWRRDMGICTVNVLPSECNRGTLTVRLWLSIDTRWLCDYNPYQVCRCGYTSRRKCHDVHRMLEWLPGASFCKEFSQALVCCPTIEEGLALLDRFNGVSRHCRLCGKDWEAWDVDVCIPCRQTAASIIQKEWRKAVSDPNMAVCRNRLMREFAEL